MRVLIVEHDAATAQAIELMLRAEGMHTYIADCGDEAVSLGKLYDYDCITLALMLPDMTGFEVVKRLRTAKCRTPIVVVSGMADLESKVRALDLGADDYLTKPFHKNELIARMSAVVRRSKGIASPRVTVGELSIDLVGKRADIGGVAVHLTGKEWGCLELLAMRQGSPLTKEMFLNHLYGGMDEPELKIIDVFICKLRKKLNAASSGKHFIETLWGRGYCLVADAAAPLSRVEGSAARRAEAAGDVQSHIADIVRPKSEFSPHSPIGG